METQRKFLTLDLLLNKFYFTDNISEVVEFANTFQLEYEPIPSNKPLLAHNHTTADVLHYAELLKVYEDAIKANDNFDKKYRKRKQEIHQVIIEYLRVISNFDEYVPEQYQDGFYALAENRHDRAYDDLLEMLRELANIFKNASINNK